MRIWIFLCNFVPRIIHSLKMRRIVLVLLCVLGFGMTRAALPSVTLADIDGNSVSIAELAQKGKPVIISFFATWCKPCMRELKALDEVYEDWKDETGVTIYIVSIDQAQDIQKVKPLVDGNGWDFEVLLDPNGTLKRAMNVQQIPHVFVVDSKGKIVYNHVGYNPGDELTLRTYLR